MPVLLALLVLLAGASHGLGASDESLQSSPGTACNDFNESLDYDYQRIDELALSTPLSAERSIKSLAAYLTKPAGNDREKARSIFRWVTNNIDYDAQALFQGDHDRQRSEDLLESRVSVCDGYSDIFQALAKEAGLEAVKISGYGKGYSYEPGEALGNSTNHAWNAVKLDGKWFLVDCTWGAGYVNEQRMYVRKFDSHYFMTPPCEFIFDHYPEDSRWQLLERPILRVEFERLVLLKPEFFEFGLDIGDHTAGEIAANGSINISLNAPADVLMMAVLEEKQERSSSFRVNLDEFVFVQRKDLRYDIHAAFPSAGDYVLGLYAKKKDDPGDYRQVAEYGIAAAAAGEYARGYPLAYGRFSDAGAFLLAPMSGWLKVGLPQSVMLRVPKARNVSVINAGNWTGLAQTGDQFEGTVTPSRGDVIVCANFEGDRYEGLIRYRAD